jgi:hypothetical protein
VAIGYVEFVGGTAGVGVRASIEIAKTAAGPAIIATPLAIQASQDAGRFSARGALPIGALPPGDYVVRALVGGDGQPIGQITRTMRKVQ